MIRRATGADAGEIARIINAAFEIEREFRQGDRTSASEIHGLMNRDAFLVAEHGGRLIGAVEVRVRGETGYFGMLAVDASARHAGIGRALVEAAEEHCRRAGCTVMTMSTGEDRTELIPILRKDGLHGDKHRALHERSFQASDSDRQNGEATIAAGAVTACRRRPIDSLLPRRVEAPRLPRLRRTGARRVGERQDPCARAVGRLG